DFFMEASGYSTSSSNTSLYNAMKADALAHCLSDGGHFVVPWKGHRAIHDFCNEYTLTWMFPHLDPFVLGGFDDPHWHKPVSMAKQLAHLLHMANSRFEEEPTFAFVFHNILQKREAACLVRFHILDGRHTCIVEDIQQIPGQVFSKLADKLQKSQWAKVTLVEEEMALRVLHKVHMLRHDVPSSDAYKWCHRNEIRSLV
ncbi:hypothetical protein DACRYDRAFT_43915, partial [Dacryopinax primogenitus]